MGKIQDGEQVIRSNVLALHITQATSLTKERLYSLRIRAPFLMNVSIMSKVEYDNGKRIFSYVISSDGNDTISGQGDQPDHN